MATEWRSDGLVAWTERDGPGRPPAGPGPVLTTALSAGLGLLFLGILFTDLLCPEHRFWVQGLGSLAVFGSIVAAIGLARGWASAAFLALPATVCGVAACLLLSWPPPMPTDWSTGTSSRATSSSAGGGGPR